MYHIEFIGVPGSGKTTIRNILIERFKATDRKRFLSLEDALLQVSQEKIEKIYRIILNVLPKKMALVVSNKLLNRSLLQYDAQNRFLAEWGKSLEAFFNSSAFDNIPMNEKEIVISSFLETGSLYQCIKGQLPKETVVFFEEGFVQKSFMFISPLDKGCLDTEHLFYYLNNIPIPDLVIYVNNDLTSCYERMLARSAGLTRRLRKLDNHKIINFLEISDKHLRNAVHWLNRNKAINLLEVNSDQDLHQAINELEQKMKPLLG